MSNKVKTEYGILRARLIERGTNLKRFSQDYGFSYSTVISAAKRQRGGIISVQIQKKLKEVACA